MICGIYCLTFPSGKSYIGQSIDIERRVSVYRRGACKCQRRLYNALTKYGFDSFKWIVLEECERTELDEFESFYIHYFNTSSTGYNLTIGGQKNGRANVETRKLLSDSKSGQNNYFYNREFTDSHKRKISQSKIGEKHHMFGKSHNIESKSQMTKTRRDKNPNWGIYSHGASFRVIFKENGKTFRKIQFKTVEDARSWRDNQLINFSH